MAREKQEDEPVELFVKSVKAGGTLTLRVLPYNTVDTVKAIWTPSGMNEQGKHLWRSTQYIITYIITYLYIYIGFDLVLLFVEAMV